VGKARVQRIWRREGLKVPQRHRPRSRLWLNDGSGKRLRPLHRDRVWSFDFVQVQTHDGRSLRILTLIDEHSRARLALKAAGRINSQGVIEALADAMRLHVIPEHIRCDNGPEMIAQALRKRVAKTGAQIQDIAPGSPWENGYCESFNGKLRDECLPQEIVYSLKNAQAVIGRWQNTYNRVRPRSSLGYRPSAPVTFPDLAFRLPTPGTMQEPRNWPGPKYRSRHRAIGAEEHLKKHQPETQEGGARHEAELHAAQPRAFLARGRIMALKRTYHAHQACGDAPTEGLRSVHRRVERPRISTEPRGQGSCAAPPAARLST
jgi:putative transposase